MITHMKPNAIRITSVSLLLALLALAACKKDEPGEPALFIKVNTVVGSVLCNKYQFFYSIPCQILGLFYKIFLWY